MDEGGATRISVDELDPVIFFTIDSMGLGSISRPIDYRTDDGKDAVRILYYKSRLRPHQANLKEDWQKIQAAALNQKRARILNEWFNKARHDVFINLDEEYNYCNILN